MNKIQILNNENLERKETISELLKRDTISVKVDGGWVDEPTDQFINNLKKGVEVELLCPYCLHGKEGRNGFSFSAALAMTARGRGDRRKGAYPMNSFHKECLEMARKDEENILKTVSLLYGSEENEAFFYKGIERAGDEVMDFIDGEGEIFDDNGKVKFKSSTERLLERLSMFSPTTFKDFVGGNIEFDPTTQNLTRHQPGDFGLDALL